MLYFIRFIVVFTFAFGCANGIQANDAPIELTAEHALEWDRNNQTVTAKGKAALIQGADSVSAQTITATYNDDGQDGMAIHTIIATPNAQFQRPSETLMAETITAVFKQGALSEVIAENNVILKTNSETLYGETAVYDSQKRLITVTGDVRIEQGDNILTGTKAEFDLNTSISRLTAAKNHHNGRVKAIFHTKGTVE